MLNQIANSRAKIFFLLFAVILFFLPNGVKAQQPFVTDDADVTEKGKFSFEFSNQFDRLQKSAFPTKYQNTASFELNYGLLENLEIAVEIPVVTLINDSSVSPQTVSGVGDANVGFKYNIRKERDGSPVPAFTISANLELPTGDFNRQIGSGIADFGVNGIVQKTFKGKNIWRVNTGIIFSNNKIAGVQAASARGVIFTGSTLFVRKINDKLQLGGEVTGAAANNFELGQGLLQVQFGGNYQLNKKATFDFSVIGGRNIASPRLGLQLGMSVDF